MDPDRLSYLLILFASLFFIINAILKKNYEKSKYDDVYFFGFSNKQDIQFKKMLSYQRHVIYGFNIIEVVFIAMILFHHWWNIVLILFLLLIKPWIQNVSLHYQSFLIKTTLPLIFLFLKPSFKFSKPLENKKKASEKQIIDKIEWACENKEITEQETLTLKNILSFKHKRIKDSMKTDRLNIKAISISSSLIEVKKEIQKTKFSRYPVFKNNIDNIVGILYAKDFILLSDEDLKTKDVAEIMTPSEKMNFVFSGQPLSSLFENMKRSGNHMAIICDEFGGTVGLVTFEDILETILGDIGDEKDKSEEKWILEKNEERIIAHAKIPLSILNTEFGCSLQNEKVDTLGGYLTDYLRYIPKKGEQLIVDGLEFNILSAENKRICLVKIVKREV